MRLVLEPTRSLKVLQFCQRGNITDWGKFMPVEGYIKRELISYQGKLCDFFRQTDVNADLYDTPVITQEYLMSHGVIYWVLRDLDIESTNTNEPEMERTDNIVSACETLMRQAYLNSEIVKAATIGSVYTFPEHRRKGFCAKMIELLVEQLDLLDVAYSTLYSEVGEYYAKFGYVSLHTPDNAAKLLLDSCTYDIPEYSSMTEEKFDQVMKHYDAKLVKAIECSLPSSCDNILSIRPDSAVLTWQANRSKSTFHPTYQIPYESLDSYGIILNNDLDSGYAYWFYNIGETREEGNHVYICLMHAKSLDHLKQLMQCVKAELCKVAKKMNINLKKIEFWDDDLYKSVSYNESLDKKEVEKVLSDVFGEENLKLGFENDSLSAVRFKGINNVDEVDEFNWLNNSKWCWY